MGNYDPCINAYIAKSADFAKPILEHLRRIVHAACPEVEETLKWGMPSFMYKGILCGMAAFKQHCTFGFWKGSLIVDGEANGVEEAMGQFGRIRQLADLPSAKVLTGYVKTAMKLNDDGIKVPARSRSRPKAALVVPDYIIAALKKSRKAMFTFENFSPSNKREYVEWITQAKGEDTRKRRLDQAVEWMAEGKPRNWKYMNC